MTSSPRKGNISDTENEGTCAQQQLHDSNGHCIRKRQTGIAIGDVISLFLAANTASSICNNSRELFFKSSKGSSSSSGEEPKNKHAFDLNDMILEEMVDHPKLKDMSKNIKYPEN
ncbi:hypothetical protein Tco_0422848 [Tanacetum coccineum]